MKGHRFQEMYTGVQIIIWHKIDTQQARQELAEVVKSPSLWVFLGLVDQEKFNQSTSEI